MEMKPTDVPDTTIEGKAIELVNKKSWEAIEAEVMALQHTPREDGIIRPATVGDIIRIMDSKGNAEYMDAFYPDITQRNPELRKTSFDYTYARHEISHIAPRLGHTPQHEFWQVIFEQGLQSGVALRNASPLEKMQFSAGREIAEKRYKKNMATYTDDTPQIPSKRDTAIYMAAGMYLREKIDSYIQQGLLVASYSQQKTFCDSYENKDAAPVELSSYWKDNYHKREFFESILNAPRELIAISPTEWKAIIATATNVPLPESCKTPQRMTAVKEALVATKLLFDRPEFVEKLKQKQALNGQRLA